MLIFSLYPAAFCAQIPTPSHGEVQGFRFEQGATLRVNCEVGYDLIPASSSFRKCEEKGGGGGQWSGQDPVCQRTYAQTERRLKRFLSQTSFPVHDLEKESCRAKNFKIDQKELQFPRISLVDKPPINNCSDTCSRTVDQANQEFELKSNRPSTSSTRIFGNCKIYD